MILPTEIRIFKTLFANHRPHFLSLSERYLKRREYYEFLTKN